METVMSEQPKTHNSASNWSVETRMVHDGTMRSSFGETSEALYLTQGFVYDSSEAAEARFAGEDDGYIYSRYANPTVTMFEQRMCALEGAEAALATTSGMAAVTSAMLCQLKAGDHVVAAHALFGSCRYVIETLLPQFGVSSTFVDGKNLDEWKQAMRPETTVLFLESPTNPTLELVDIAEVANLAKENNARLVVDNVFATPLWQKPLELGADVVVYSATKHIDGQGRCLGGVVLSSQEWIDENLFDFYRHTGPGMSPFNAWVLLKGLETLPVRVRYQSTSAAKIADAIAGQKNISRLIYPGRSDYPQIELAKKQMGSGSTMVAFEFSGGKAQAFAFQKPLKIIRIYNNNCDAKSLITHPATTTHKNLSEENRDMLGISSGLVRLSIGLEDTDDLINDITRAIDMVAV
jgi:O-succinylhomoserine sulfhydrylase